MSIAALVALVCVFTFVRTTLNLESGGSTIEVWPGARSARFLNRLVDERIAATLGAWLLPKLGLLRANESPHLATEMWTAYGELEAEAGAQPSPVVATYLGLQTPDAFDTVVLSPPGDASPETAVVILHGFGGNFSLSCWLFARAVLDAQMLAVCPSAAPMGAWWSEDGEAIVRATLTELGRRGVKRAFLAGLSNGGIGASRLIARLRAKHDANTPSLAGLVLVSGADANGTTGGLPTLVIQGDRDTMVPPGGPRAFAEKYRANYQEVRGGHFVLLERREELARTMTRWLRATEHGAAASP